MKKMNRAEFIQQYFPASFSREEFLNRVQNHLGTEVLAKFEAEIPVTKTVLSRNEAFAILRKVLMSQHGEMQQLPEVVIGSRVPSGDSDLDMSQNVYHERYPESLKK